MERIIDQYVTLYVATVTLLNDFLVIWFKPNLAFQQLNNLDL